VRGYKKSFLYDTLYFVKITGKIVHGAGRGRGLGFPTINLDIVPADLGFGVYAAWVFIGELRLAGAVNYGTRPTFNEEVPVLEVFLLDFSGDEYGEEATVELVQKIRDIQKFASPEELKVQMGKDVEEIRRVLGDA